MIVHHQAGEFTAGLMSRQYRPAFNTGATVFTTASLNLMWIDMTMGLVPAVLAAGAYLVNWRGRRNRVRPSELKKPTRLTEDQILELQDIHFHMPKEHQHLTERLLLGAYEQIERGNIDAVNPRLEKARQLRAGLLAINARLDQQEDIKEVETQQRAMLRAIEA